MTRPRSLAVGWCPRRREYSRASTSTIAMAITARSAPIASRTSQAALATAWRPIAKSTASVTHVADAVEHDAAERAPARDPRIPAQPAGAEELTDAHGQHVVAGEAADQHRVERPQRELGRVRDPLPASSLEPVADAESRRRRAATGPTSASASACRTASRSALRTASQRNTRADGQTDDGDERLAATSASGAHLLRHARSSCTPRTGARTAQTSSVEAVVRELELVGRRQLARAVGDQEPLGAGGLERSRPPRRERGAPAARRRDRRGGGSLHRRRGRHRAPRATSSGRGGRVARVRRGRLRSTARGTRTSRAGSAARVSA